MKKNSERLFVNFSRSRGFIHNTLKEEKFNIQKDVIIDVIGNCSSITGIKALKLDSFAANRERIESAARKEFVQCVGDLSNRALDDNTSFRDIKIQGLSLYWLTPWAIKHPVEHWGFLFFLFKTTIKQSESLKKLFQNASDIVIVFPNANKKFIEELYLELLTNIFILLNAKLTVKIDSIRPSKIERKLRPFNVYIVFVIKYMVFKKINQVESRHEIAEEFHNIFISTGIEPKKDRDIEFFFQKECENKAIPIYLNNLPLEKLCDRDNLDFFSHLPSFKTVLILVKESIFLTSFLNKRQKGLPPLGKLITEEMISLIQRPLVALNYLWLKNYFGNIPTATNVLYADEFYQSGRLISSAITHSHNRFLKSYGFQHGLIGSHHTVYNICDAELRGVNALPKPSKFIAWGKHFKELLLKNNTLPGSYVLLGLHPKYLGGLQESKVVKNDSPPKIKHLRILWCTTEINVAHKEYEIICEALNNSPGNHSIRFHPNHPLCDSLNSIVSNDDIREKLKINTDHSIYNAIEGHDIIFCSNPSTVILDALLLSKTVVSLTSDFFLPFVPFGKVENFYSVKNKEELDETMREIASNIDSTSQSILNDLVYPPDKVWRRVLQSY